MKEEKMLTTKQVANIFQVQHYTVRRWARLNKIKAVKVGRSWLISQKEVERVKEEGIN